MSVTTRHPDLDSAPGIDVKSIKSAGKCQVPTILQIEAVECGAASLAMVLAHFKCWIPLRELRQACGVSRDGSSAIDVVKAAKKYGLAYKVVKGDLAALDGITVPAILWWNKSHFIVLERISNGKVTVNDPAMGRITMSADEFAGGYSGIAITFASTDAMVRTGKKFSPIPGIRMRLSKSHRGVTLAFLAGLLALIPGLLVPAASDVFVTQVLEGNAAQSTVIALCVGLVAIAIVRLVLNQVQNMALARLQVKLAVVDSSRLLTHMLRLPLSFFNQRTSGDLMQRVSLPNTVAQQLVGQVASSLISLVAVIGYGALLFWYSPAIAVVVLVLSLLNLVALRFTVRRLRDADMLSARESATVMGTTVQIAQGIETLKSSGGEDAAYSKWATAQARATTASSKLAGAGARLSAIPTLVSAFTAIAILMIGALQIESGAIAIGTLVAIQAAAAGLTQPISQLVSMAGLLQSVAIDIERMDDVLVEPVAARYSSAPNSDVSDPDAGLVGRIEFRDVTFGYGRPDRPLIRNFNLVIEPGARVALVGSTGSGKSTIAALAAGLLEPWSGEVLYDGAPIAHWRREVVARSLAKVDQQIVLFPGTIRDNITLWDNSIASESIERALADAQILDEVRARPGGIHASVEEGGRNFSGGQRQRLEIARALVRDPQMVILDEATSALDTMTEQAVDRSLRARGCTCLIIAHRLSTIRDSDEIIVLGARGRVVVRGKHDDLMAAGGVYASLVLSAGLGGNVGSS